MLFSPRYPPTWPARLRVALWPRRSAGRSLRYIRLRVVRMAGSAHGLAAGVAAGVFVATLPVPGIQLLLAATLAWLIGANVAAALLGTFWANPLTMPLFWFSSHWLGQQLLGSSGSAGAGDVLARLGHIGGSWDSIRLAYVALWPVLKPVAVGSLVLGAVGAALFYTLTLRLIARYRHARGTAVIAARVDLAPGAAVPLAA